MGGGRQVGIAFIVDDRLRAIANAQLMAAAPTILAENIALRAELARAQAVIRAAEVDLTQARAFIVDMFDEARWPDGGDIDGFSFQDAAEKHGLLIPQERTEPCGDNCPCMENLSADEMAAGFTCYRKVQWLVDCAARGAEKT